VAQSVQQVQQVRQVRQVAPLSRVPLPQSVAALVRVPAWLA
jgi:hypothetical protein